MSQPSDYFNERLEDQRQWHERKANWNKRRFYFVEIAIIVLGALIPVINSPCRMGLPASLQAVYPR